VDVGSGVGVLEASVCSFGVWCVCVARHRVVLVLGMGGLCGLRGGYNCGRDSAVGKAPLLGV
jgi:hypothetical protein